MSNSTSYAPPGESASDLWAEKTVINGDTLAGVTYGILFTLASQTLHLFINSPKSKRSWGLIAYVLATLSLATIAFGSIARVNQLTFVDDRNFPGGPNAFNTAFYSSPINMACLISYVIMGWMGDALMLWRFTLIYGYNYWLSLFPGLMYLGSIVTSIILLVAITQSSEAFWSTRSMEFAIAYWSLSISLNIILALAIAGRIWFVRRRIHKLLGPQHSSSYVSIAAMVIESAALNALWDLVFIICYARNTPFQNILVGHCPLYRVAQGRAWSAKTAEETALEFNRGVSSSVTTSGPTTQHSGGQSARSFKLEHGLKISDVTDNNGSTQ
ncbi:hypothetical protein GGX14DRAFT_578777 [Mycena pura]|uniref:Uncharacterized protein n=1 Tax=Mycena pura TaxID=153505 RepID=A0AAD6UNS2_9AGAR|nr:hypothetical protein GGX14DRAFT_578777 [Mycena pura]